MSARRAAVCLCALLLACGRDAGQPVSGPPSQGLVFVRYRGDNADLVRLRLADGAERPLVETGDRDELWPYWSPRAGLLVFQARGLRSGPDDRLLLLDPTTGQVEPVPPAGARRQHWAAWSQDGTRLAYVFDGPGADGGIGVYDRTAGSFRAVAEAKGRVRWIRPEFAPDGRRLVAERVDDREHGIWILAPGAAPQRLTAAAVGFVQKARFTRDGAWVVFTRRSARGRPGAVLRVRPGRGEAGVVADVRGADDHSSRPSPTRDELVFISDREGTGDAFRVDVEGGTPHPLTRTPDWDERSPRWSPDGEYVVMTAIPTASARRRPNPDSRVVVVDREGRRLLEVPGTMADWMPPW